MLLHSSTRSAAELLTNLAADPDVVFVEPNYIVQLVLTPNDPSFGLLWGLKNNSTPGADINATAAWDVTTGSTANVVGVIDTGVLYTHPDLSANIWNAPAQFTVTVGGQNITCAAGTHGFRVINGVRSCTPLDDHFHGTHVSGTIGAVGNNSLGVVGVNWTTRIMGLKFLNSGGSGNIADAVDLISFARQVKTLFPTDANIRILNNSWGGGGFSQAFFNEVVAANQADMLFVAAAGNNGSDNDLFPFYPSSYNVANVISVAATTISDGKAGFSNYGDQTVHLGAPGENIYSTTLGNGYQYASGTSMASPHVAGAAALILSVCNLNTADLKSNILNNGDSIPSMAGVTITGRRLDVNNSIQACNGGGGPNFTISATPASQTVAAGGSTAYTISIAPIDGFNGTVNLSLSNPPNGVTGSFLSNQIFGGSGSTTLNIQTTALAAVGTHTLTVTGINGGLNHSTNPGLVITPGFSLAPSPTSRTIVQGGSTSYYVGITRSPGFSGPVAFTVSGAGAGITATFTPNPASGANSSLAINAANDAAPGTYQLTITGTGGGQTRTAIVNLTVNVPDFSISPYPTSRTINPGGSTSYNINLTRVAGFTASIAFSISGLPSGATATFNPAATTSNFSQLSIVTDTSVPPGTHTLTVTGIGGGLTRTANITLIVNGISGFTMVASPPSQTINPGGSTTYTVTLARAAGFVDSVAFSLAGLPANATGSFNPPATTGNTSTLTITTLANVAPGTHNLTITGMGGGFTRTAPVTLIVNGAPDFSLTPSPASRTIVQGGSSTFYVALSRIGGFNSSVSFSISGLPSGVTGTFNPAATTGTFTTLTVVASAVSATGTFPLTITGTGGGLTRTANVTLVVNVPDFSISPYPLSRTIVRGGSTTFNMNLTRVGGFTAPISFSISGLPAGATGTFNPPSTPSNFSQLSVGTDMTVAPGTYPLTVTGIGGGLTRTANITLVINP